jgi:DNA mismatch endonuclease, patch repair protein
MNPSSICQRRIYFWCRKHTAKSPIEQGNKPDVFTKEKRSEVMSHIRGKGNKDTELAMIRILRRYHISGWRRNQILFGKPDFVFPKQKIALFVDGCFWHGCPKHSNMPRNNQEFWQKKLQGNKDRDKLVSKVLRKLGWKVVRVWEHELNNPSRVAAKLMKHFDSA